MAPSFPLDRRTFLAQSVLGLTASQMLFTQAWAEDAKALASVPTDVRLGKLKNLDGYFPMTVPATKEAWLKRAEELRRQMLVATGLWPMPSRPEIKATIHGIVERDGYTVERVFFESSPGLYVTGSLYRPQNPVPKRPGVLCPHGHWNNGRFFDHGEAIVKKEIESGAEKYPVGGRYPLQARCVALARLGCVVFHYDMLGYADSVPFSQGLAHGFRKQRSSMSQPDHWGLFSAQSELRLLSVLGIQTFNSVRAMDFITALPDVDPTRVAVTGASGGGTQTFMLMAVDDRPAVAFPAVMVSTAMQGGCTCENATYLRVNTGNIEIAALAAPRPLGMSAANDWTQEFETKGLPELKKLYDMLGAPDNVAGKHFPFGHNYNYVSRAMMLEFMNKHLGLGQAKPIVEQDYKPLSVAELTVWTDAHPKPAMDEAAEIKALRALADDSDQQIAALTPRDKESFVEYRRVIGGAWESMIGRKMPDATNITFNQTGMLELPSGVAKVGAIHHSNAGEVVECTHFISEGTADKGKVLWLHPRGKSSTVRDGDVIPMVKALLKQGVDVVAIDLLGQGNSTKAVGGAKSRAIENGREAACFAWGYNHPLFAQRVHDVLTAIARLASESRSPIKLAAMDGAAPWAAAAVPLAGDFVRKAYLDTAGFRFAQITDIEDPQLLPGALKYGDLPGLLGLCAPTPIWIGGEGSLLPEVTKACYEAVAAGDAIKATQAASPEVIVEWLAG